MNEVLDIIIAKAKSADGASRLRGVGVIFKELLAVTGQKNLNSIAPYCAMIWKSFLRIAIS